MPLLDGPSLGGNARHVLRQYAEENALARGRAANAAGTEEFGGGCLRGRYNNLREVIQNNPSLVVVPSIINAGSLFVQRPICRTNYLPNNSMAGATGGLLPTNWSIASLPAGITVSYSASGTAVAADGTSVNYIDVTVSGTAGASGFLNIRPNPSPSTIAAFVGQSWNTSVYLQLISGSVASVSPTWQLQELNSSQGFLQGSNITGLGSLVVGGQFDRYNVSRVLTDSATAFVTCRWGHSFVSGTTYSYTLRIGSPQLERFSVPTPMIATSTGAVTRLNESTNVVGLPPDFTVSRNTGATRVGPNGLIETGNTNLALQSAGFEVSGNWSPTNITVTTGSTTAFTAPDGTTNADLLTSTASGSARIIQSFSFVSGTTYTYSAFAKAGSGFFGLTMENGGVASGVAVIWNLNTGAFAVSGVVGTGYTLQSQGIENYGNGWYRCRMTVLMSVSVAGNIRANTSNGTMTTTVIQSDNGNNVYVWGAQVEVGSTASEYIPTTTVARTRFAGVTVDGTIAANIPRIDWLGQSCPGLLVEPAATNQIRNNSMVGAVAGSTGTMPTNWAESLNGLVRQSVALGTENGVSYIDIRYSGTATGGSCAVLFETATQIVASTGQTWSNSVYLKIIAQPNPPNAYRLGMWEYNTSGTVFGGSFATNVVPTTTSLQRFTQTRALTGATTDRVRPLFDVSMTSGQTYDFTIRIGYPQMEQSSFATSVIPTTTGTGSRAADVISASGALVSGLIGQTEGTIYCEFAYFGTPTVRSGPINLWQASLRGLSINYSPVDSPLGIVFISRNDGGDTKLTIVSGALQIGTYYKIAIGYDAAGTAAGGSQASGVVAYVNGVQTAIGTFRVPDAAGLTQFRMYGANAGSDTEAFNGRIRAAALYTTRLSNAQLAELTRL